MSQIRELTTHSGLVEKLTILEQEKDSGKGIALFHQAEGYALDVLVSGEPLFNEANRESWRQAWQALRAKYPSPTIPRLPKYDGPKTRGWDRNR